MSLVPVSHPCGCRVPALRSALSPHVPEQCPWSPCPCPEGATSQPQAVSLVPVSQPWGSPRPSPEQCPGDPHIPALSSALSPHIPSLGIPTSHSCGCHFPAPSSVLGPHFPPSGIPTSQPHAVPPHPIPELCLHPLHIPSQRSSSSVRATRVPTHTHPLISSPTRALLCSGTCRAQLRAAIGTHRSGAAAPICPLQFCLPPSPAMDFSTAPCSRSSVIRLRALRSNPRKLKVTAATVRCSQRCQKRTRQQEHGSELPHGTNGLMCVR